MYRCGCLGLYRQARGHGKTDLDAAYVAASLETPIDAGLRGPAPSVIMSVEQPKSMSGQSARTEDERVNILIVDDRPDKLLALEAALLELGENVVGAHSGKEALRCLLQQDFA